MAEFLKGLWDVGKEILTTIRERAKLSTLFDAYTEKAIPTFVSEADLKAHYEKRMRELNDFIYKM